MLKEKIPRSILGQTGDRTGGAKNEQVDEVASREKAASKPGGWRQQGLKAKLSNELAS